REAFLFCPNSHYSGKKTDYQTNKQKKTNIKRDVCLHSDNLLFINYFKVVFFTNWKSIEMLCKISMMALPSSVKE
ncbi:TPA: hypothetical protein ACHU7V_001086, partial [Streptococcus suis]|uniref:hypothetical protein n=2 Tax=Streptococcus suis TaxID=1307 RepID=UPI001EDD7324